MFIKRGMIFLSSPVISHILLYFVISRILLFILSIGEYLSCFIYKDGFIRFCPDDLSFINHVAFLLYLKVQLILFSLKSA